MSKSGSDNRTSHGAGSGSTTARTSASSRTANSELRGTYGSGMARFRTIACVILVIELLVIGICNFLLLGSLKKDASRQYRVDISRAAEDLDLLVAVRSDSPAQIDIRRGDPKPDPRLDFDIEKYPSLLRIATFDANEVVNNDYAVKEILGTLIRFEYEVKPDIRPLIYMDIGLGLSLLITVVILIYVGRKILRPFNAMSTLSVDLARGNLNASVKEDKNKFFGKFLWGIDMLRDNLETNKERELELQKEKKTLILSLSHDIKTPLSAIKLYSKALNEDIYDSDEQRRAAISGIAHNAEEIEKYVSDIVTASKEDFLNLEVTMGEVYLNEIMDRIKALYTEKFASLRTDFTIEEYSNVLLSGDSARLEEVLQNLLENAIKYGDGRYVKISFSDEEDCRLITVTNSGCTVKEEEIPHLFESFYRGSNSEKAPGSGLGLYIARSLMRMMRGDIFAEKVPASASAGAASAGASSADASGATSSASSAAASGAAEAKENTGDFSVTVVVKKA